jgi:hypothetical protein
MVDTTSIIISVIAAVGALLAAGIAGWVTLHSDHLKRLSKSQKLVLKYRDPLLLAAEDLHHFISLYIWRHSDKRHDYHETDDHDNAYRYASFVVGQYLSWANILRRQTQFLCFATDKGNKNLVAILDEIKRAFSETGPEDPDTPAGREDPDTPARRKDLAKPTGRKDLDKQFTLWRGQQMAIGEIMTVKEGDEHFCVGYGTFKEELEKDSGFSQWFRPIKEGTKAISDAKTNKNAFLTTGFGFSNIYS